MRGSIIRETKPPLTFASERRSLCACEKGIGQQRTKKETMNQKK
jgi:hypothetical protein